MFMLPESWAPAGSTPIGTIAISWHSGRTHLANGVSPSGKRVLSRESTARMQSVSHDMGTPNVPPIGLGWLLMPFGTRPCSPCQEHRPAEWQSWPSCRNTTCLSQPLATIRGRWRSMTRFCSGYSGEHLNVEVPDLVYGHDPGQSISLRTRARTARINCVSMSVSWTASSRRSVTYEPHRRRPGADLHRVRRRHVPLPPRRFCTRSESISSHRPGCRSRHSTAIRRQLLVSYHGVGDDDGPTYRCAGGRMTRRVPNGAR